MTPFRNVLSAELRLIFSRPSAWLCIACSVFVAIVIPWLMSAAVDGIEVQASSEVAAQGMANMMQEQIGKDVAKGMGRALWGRNFILIPLLILLAASSCLSAAVHRDGSVTIDAPASSRRAARGADAEKPLSTAAGIEISERDACRLHCCRLRTVMRRSGHVPGVAGGGFPLERHASSR